MLIVFAAQPPAGGHGEIPAVVGSVRAVALQRLRRQIAIAFDDDERGTTTDQLARFALATLDGAFFASQADSSIALKPVLEPLPPALVAARRALLTRAR